MNSYLSIAFPTSSHSHQIVSFLLYIWYFYAPNSIFSVDILFLEIWSSAKHMEKNSLFNHAHATHSHVHFIV
jgi:hypothetical protein